MSSVYRLDIEARERLMARLRTELNGRSDVLFAFVFGSFLDRGAFRDIDVGIFTTDSAGPRLDIELAAALSEACGVPVDVRRINAAPAPFLFHVLRGRAVAVRDETRLADLMERTAREYHDRAPFLRRATEDAFAR